MRAKTKVKFKLSTLKGKLPYKDSFFDAVIAVRALYQAKMADIEKIMKNPKLAGYSAKRYLAVIDVVMHLRTDL